MTGSNEKSFLKAMMDHLRLSSDSMTQFAMEIKKLDTKDREDLKTQFEKEFGYTITGGNPQVDKGIAA